MTDKPTFIRDAGLARPERKPRMVQRFKLEEIERAEEEKLRKVTELGIDGPGEARAILGATLYDAWRKPGQIVLTHPKRLPVNFHWDFWGPLALGVSIGFLLGLLALGRA